MNEIKLKFGSIQGKVKNNTHCTDACYHSVQ